ncbi:MAG: 5'/3'-nucleotidase SurE [Spirochaetota bacterium]
MKSILLSNDDGIHSRGLWELWEYLKKDFEVYMVAPDRERSAAGHSISLHDPLRISMVEEGRVYSVNGTPVDSVHVALLGVVQEPIDIVITGINNGMNLGSDVFYSGTVSAAFQATTFNIPGIAVSIDNIDRTIHYQTAAYFVKRLVYMLKDHTLERKVILNVNVPNLPWEKIKGVEITRLGTRYYNDNLIEREDPKKIKYYWIQGVVSEEPLEEGTDIKAVKDGKISITPLRMDITAHDYLEKLKGWEFNKLI